MLTNLPSALAILALLPALSNTHPFSSSSTPLPLIIWHGLGDKFDNPGLLSVGDLAREIHPKTHIHYITLSPSDDPSADRTATFFGNLTDQITQVCTDLSTIPQLRNPANQIRVDALGFSQGGQFLRGLIQRCPDLHVRSLVTFGAQHNGIAEFQTCGEWDFLCKGATALLQGNAYSEYVQGRVVPAQYYRTVNETTGEASEAYLEHSNFLADVNNERGEKRGEYKVRLGRVEKFVMFVFEDDTTVIPKESGWFAEVNGTSGEVTGLRDRRLYKEDWIGLKRLDKKRGLVFRKHPGGHMQLDDKILAKTFEEFYGEERKGWSWRTWWSPKQYL